MITRENITVPANIRTEFDTSKINTEINTVEEALKDQQILGDNPYIPTPDERTLNVVQRIKETSTYYKGDAGFTNVWEYKEGVTPVYKDGDQIIYLISNDIQDPSVFLGATLINAEGESLVVTESSIAEMDGDAYIVGGDEVAFILVTSVGGIEPPLPAGAYTTDYDGGNTTVVKIIATSDIFPVL